ncbi:hypothetical protein BASA81_000146 [Batrachochytrium salamandrivorans]|nr:hypothetical protein BASA81_000146 [Batrachochytrium salamandrivorans]
MSEASSTSPSLRVALARRWQHTLDKSVVHLVPRWIFAFVLLAGYWVRVYLLGSHHIITYGLHIYLLNLLIGFLSPQFDPDSEQVGEGEDLLPTSSKRGDGEFRPFSRRLPEFKFWQSVSYSTACSLLMTCFSLFDVPVFWPILLGYFIALFFLTMRRQISHMIKHRYVPCSFGKKKYTKRDTLNV